MTPEMRTAFDEVLNQPEIPAEQPREPDPVVKLNRQFVAGLASIGAPIPTGVPRT